MLTKRTRARIEQIKREQAASRESIEILQQALDREWPTAKWPNPTAPEVRARLERMETNLAKHRQLLDETDALIAKLEQPIWKFWKFI